MSGVVPVRPRGAERSDALLAATVRCPPERCALLVAVQLVDGRAAGEEPPHLRQFAVARSFPHPLPGNIESP
jgi:hypothetical protein